ncbi:MAG: family 10 glycosylhydrolase [Gemmatimonadota bacterium]|nr:family 10 glycosylhydrolase [Gemmatimonadota bacterium]
MHSSRTIAFASALLIPLTLRAQPNPPLAPRAASPIAEARALWVSRFDYDSPASVSRIMQRAASANFNIVYFQVRGAADAIYRSEIEPCAVLLCGHLGGTPVWDPLEVAVREAHARGVQLHAWLNAFTGWGAGNATTCHLLAESDPGKPRHMLLSHPDWSMTDEAGNALRCPNGEEYVWMSPAIPAVRNRLAHVAADIARRYEVDGIHLDRIRYPGSRWSFDPESVRQFGSTPAINDARWDDFRRSLVTAAVRDVRDSVRAARPGAVMSAAVWGIYRDRWSWHTSQGFSELAQDPHAWAEEGIVDVVVPMTYLVMTPSYCGRADWACLLDDHLDAVQTRGGRHLYIGIGADRGATEVVKQIERSRERGARGIAIYSYRAAETAGLFEALAAGVFAHSAQIPPMEWRGVTASGTR